MNSPQENAGFNDFWSVVRGRKKVVIIFFSLVVLIVTLCSFLMKPVYRSTVSLLIDIENPKVLTSTGNVAMGGSDYYAYKEYFQSQKEIIQSHNIMRQVFDEFGLGSAKDYGKSKDPINDFLKTVSVESIRDTRLMRLNVDNNDPKLAANIANRIAEIYVARNLSYISQSEVINLLKNEHLKLQAKLSEYSKIYKDRHPQMIRLKLEMEQMEERMKREAVVAGDLGNIGTSGLAIIGVSANNISIQDRAEVSKIPLRPQKRLNILLSIIVGLFGGVGLAFFFEYMDDTIKGLEDIIHLVDWPYLGSISKISSKGGALKVQKDLFVNIRPKDPIAEAYRSIRTSILFSSTEEHHLRNMIVTSPGPQEGKTVTICNLAVTMAQSKKKVLLVDADMRKPRLHEIFNKDNEKGLSSFLSEQVGLKELIQKTEIDNLFLVTGGPHPPNPSELISSHKMAEFIDHVKGEFEVTLFDTPPIAVVTDASLLARVVDGVILVLESEKTNRRVLPRVDQLLKEAHACLIGVLFNKADISRGYYYYYGKIK